MVGRPRYVEDAAARHSVEAGVVARVTRGGIVGAEVAIGHQIDEVAHRNGPHGVVVREVQAPFVVSLGGSWRNRQAEQTAEEKGKGEEFTHDAV